MITLPVLTIEQVETLPALPAADIDRAANFARQDKAPSTRAAYRADFSGEATVLVGDTPLDVAAALAAGARAVGVATGQFAASELEAAGAGAVLADLTDTAQVVAAVLADLGRHGSDRYQPRPA